MVSLFRFTAVFVLLTLVIGFAQPAHAGFMIGFSNNDAFDGDGVGDTVSFVDPANSVTGTLTTRSLIGGPGAVLNSTSGKLGINSDTDTEGDRFEPSESWAFDWDVDAKFEGVDFDAISANESFSVASNSWVGLAGIAPGNSEVSYNSPLGEFTFLNDGSDDFSLFDMTGGVDLLVVAGDDITFTYSTKLDATESTYSAGINDLSFSFVSPVPEPSSLAIFGLMGALAFRPRRR